MTNLSQILQYLYPSSQPLRDWIVRDHRGDVSVEFWSPSLGQQPTEQELAAAELPAAKHFAIAANRAEARRRIEAKWPDPIQRSAAMGVYPADKIEQMKLDIAAVIEAENTAADQIDAATTVAEVEAVTPAWPNI